MKFINILAFATAVYYGKHIRIVSSRSGTVFGASSSCSVVVSDRNSGEALDLYCSMYGLNVVDCNTESKDSAWGNFDGRIMDCRNDGVRMTAKIAVYDKISGRMGIKEFSSWSAIECGHTNENRSCQNSWLIEEEWTDS
jgi:hypothetical protein